MIITLIITPGQSEYGSNDNEAKIQAEELAVRDEYLFKLNYYQKYFCRRILCTWNWMWAFLTEINLGSKYKESSFEN